ncbi:hypothetical protein WOLCODRAFT_119044 [Wolfiporia cocos MD-104 SS10]|uniref:Uncharacterized protein n=1 Tax=Wolfiporia cocos (strain MD-104) TaxID=742152 RepID=A0A2H3JH24_WOLCO|nr:hypothetical protein WOLCODRAFT_119044 [Wolfiporia cocos MD-104 SS10]
MSTAATPEASPAHVQPLHNPSQAARVVPPQAPLGNGASANEGPAQVPGMGVKALFAKRLAGNNPKYVSPTDKMMTPVSQRLSAAKKKHFARGAKPVQPLLAQKEASSTSDDDSHSSANDVPAETSKLNGMNDDENPFN